MHTHCAHSAGDQEASALFARVGPVAGCELRVLNNMLYNNIYIYTYILYTMIYSIIFKYYRVVLGAVAGCK